MTLQDRYSRTLAQEVDFGLALALAATHTGRTAERVDQKYQKWNSLLLHPDVEANALEVVLAPMEMGNNIPAREVLSSANPLYQRTRTSLVLHLPFDSVGSSFGGFNPLEIENRLSTDYVHVDIGTPGKRYEIHLKSADVFGARLVTVNDGDYTNVVRISGSGVEVVPASGLVEHMLKATEFSNLGVNFDNWLASGFERDVCDLASNLRSGFKFNQQGELRLEMQDPRLILSGLAAVPKVTTQQGDSSTYSVFKFSVEGKSDFTDREQAGILKLDSEYKSPILAAAYLIHNFRTMGWSRSLEELSRQKAIEAIKQGMLKRFKE